MVKVKVKYFSLLRDYTGKVEEEIELGDNPKLRDLLDKVSEKYPELKLLSDDGIPAIPLVNGKYVNLDHELKEGDEVALMPPASGG